MPTNAVAAARPPGDYSQDFRTAPADAQKEPGCGATRHGTRAAYVAGCRCPEARRANREYAHYHKQRTAQAAFGATEPFSVPAAATRSVIDQLRGTGWSLRRIEATSGIGRDHLARIDGRTGRPLRTVRWATHQKLTQLLEDEPVVAGGALVDAYATWQRVRGLIAFGYPKTWIAREVGHGRALQFGEYVVTARNAEKIRDLADRYGAVPGPSQRARDYAAARGWTPDLIWQADDDAQEGCCSEETVDSIAVERVVWYGDSAGTLNDAERLDAYHMLIRVGVTPNQAAVRLGLSGTTARKFADSPSSDTFSVRSAEDSGRVEATG